MSVLALAQAGNKDLCNPGSDSECIRYGSNMCCAKIQYSFKGDSQDFHACASRPGIEYTGGQIFDNLYGFDGRWYCDGALAGVQAATALVLAAAAAVAI